MNPEALDIWNLKRILLGNVPWIFLLEVVIRIFFIYLLLVVSMRLMGKRMAGTLNRNELAALVSMAAAIGIPMQQPDKGLLPAVIIALIVISIQRGMAVWALKNKKFEAATQGDISIMVEDGCLQLEEMEKTGFSKERIFAQLRGAGIRNLGKVQRLYLESNGGFSLLRNPNPKPGLSIIPDWDEEFAELQPTEEEVLACESCGKITEDTSQYDKPCKNCGQIGKQAATFEGNEQEKEKEKKQEQEVY